MGMGVGRGSNRNKNEQMRGGCRCFNCVYVENQSAMAGDPLSGISSRARQDLNQWFARTFSCLGPLINEG